MKTRVHSGSVLSASFGLTASLCCLNAQEDVELAAALAALRLQAPAGPQPGTGAAAPANPSAMHNATTATADTSTTTTTAAAAAAGDDSHGRMECPVCLDHVTGGSGLVAFGCGHAVCPGCAARLLPVPGLTCPKCRSRVELRRCIRVFV